MRAFGSLIILVAAWAAYAQKSAPRYQFEGYAFAMQEWSAEVDVTEIQGITHSDLFWFISTRDAIYKIPRKNRGQVLAKATRPELLLQVREGFYNHFGDISYYQGRLYIATSGLGFALSSLRTVPIVIVLDEELRYVKHAHFPLTQKGAAWLAINPVNGRLYSSGPYRVLHEYSLDFGEGAPLKRLASYDLRFSHGPKSEEDWAGVPAQGGAFGKNGIFYYVLDHKYKENAGFTGVHAFRLDRANQEGRELELQGVDGAGRLSPFISQRYKPSQGGERLWEMEGLTVVSEGGKEMLYHVQLRNGEKDSAQVAVYAIENDTRLADVVNRNTRRDAVSEF